MLDLWFARKCAQAGTPMLSVPRPANWLEDRPVRLTNVAAQATLFAETRDEGSSIHSLLRSSLSTLSAKALLARISTVRGLDEHISPAALVDLALCEASRANRRQALEFVMALLKRGKPQRGSLETGGLPGAAFWLELFEILVEIPVRGCDDVAPAIEAECSSDVRAPNSLRRVIRELMAASADELSVGELRDLIADIGARSTSAATLMIDALCRSRHIATIDIDFWFVTQRQQVRDVDYLVRARHKSLMAHRTKRAMASGQCFAVEGVCEQLERAMVEAARSGLQADGILRASRPQQKWPSTGFVAEENRYPLVSVILVVRNAAHLLEQSIESILDQTYPRLELVVVDDASEDESGFIARRIQSHDSRVRTARISHRMGPYFGRNIAIGKSRGEFITFQDADDRSTPDRLHVSVDMLLGRGSLWMAAAHHVRVNQGGLPVRDNANFYVGEGPVSTIMRKSLFQRVGLFDTVMSRGDNEFRNRVSEALGEQAIGQIHEILLLCNIGEANNSLAYSRQAVDAYRSAYRNWHRRVGRAAWMSGSPSLRPFVAPDVLLPPDWPNSPRVEWFSG
jgi:hypothetical protein